MNEYQNQFNTEFAGELGVQAAKEIKEERSFAWELIGNARRDSKRWFICMLVILCMWFATIGIFVAYLSLYDYSTITTANGFYALVDSDGNMIAQDVSPEMWEGFRDWWVLNGERDTNKETNP